MLGITAPAPVLEGLMPKEGATSWRRSDHEASGRCSRAQTPGGLLCVGAPPLGLAKLLCPELLFAKGCLLATLSRGGLPISRPSCHGILCRVFAGWGRWLASMAPGPFGDACHCVDEVWTRELVFHLRGSGRRRRGVQRGGMWGGNESEVERGKRVVGGFLPGLCRDTPQIRQERADIGPNCRPR